MNRSRTLEERLHERFHARFAVAESGCWLWSGSTNGKGYGVITSKVDGRWANRYAHRISYEIHVGPIPDGLAIDHLCRTRLCVNPAHLEPVTTAENNRRMQVLVTHCPRDHEYTEANTYVRNGVRFCRECNRLSKQRARDARV